MTGGSDRVTALILGMVVVSGLVGGGLLVLDGGDEPAAAVGDAVGGDGLPSGSVVGDTDGDDGADRPRIENPIPDPERDRRGWERGVWYNATVEFDRDDGVSEAEIDALVRRASARVERLRGVEFDEPVPTAIGDREQFREQARRYYRQRPAEERLAENARYHALYLVDGATDSTDVRLANLGGGVLAYFQPTRDGGRIRLLVGNETAPDLDGAVLAQELFHAYQHRHLGVGGRRFDAATMDGEAAQDAVVEGDANEVQRRYERRCARSWDCVRPPDERGDGGDDGDGGDGGGDGEVEFGPPYPSPYLLLYHPYSDGPRFVERIRARGGRAAVDDLYRRPPASTEQVIHPAKYPDERPATVRIDATAAAEWRRVSHGGADHTTVGEAGMYVMFLAPNVSDVGVSTLPTVGGFVGDGGDYNYTSRYSAGWAGDRLVVYRRAGGIGDPADEEFAYVWRTRWDTVRDARQFRAGYDRLVDARGGRRVANDTYRFPDDTGFGGVIHVDADVDDRTVTVARGADADAVVGVYPPAGDGDVGAARGPLASVPRSVWQVAGATGAVVAGLALTLGAIYVVGRRRGP